MEAVMNRAEARDALREHLAVFRGLAFADLKALVPASPLVGDRIGASGTRYQTEVRVEWEGTPGTALRVSGAIDDAGWRALTPLEEQFVVRADEPTTSGGVD
jgi:hypothetical protein